MLKKTLSDMDYYRLKAKYDDKDNFEKTLGKHDTILRNSLESTLPFASNINGYLYGSKIGHPFIGFIAGKEGALGAASSYNDKISIGDIYSNGKLKNKIIGGAIGGAIGGYALSKIDPERYTITIGDTDKKITQVLNDNDPNNDNTVEDIINNGDAMETVIPNLAFGALTGAVILPTTSGAGYLVGKGLGKLTSRKKY